MNGILNPDGKLYALGGWLWDLFYLNLLTLLSSIPVITIGTSISAMQYTLFKLKQNECSGITACFFHSFRDNFKQSIILSLFLVVSIYLLWLDKQIVDIYGNIGLKVFLIIIAVMISELFTWSITLLSRYQNTLWHTFRNAGKLCIAHPLRSLGMSILTMLPIILPLIDIILLLPVLLIGISFCGWFRLYLYSPIFHKYEETHDIVG